MTTLLITFYKNNHLNLFKNQSEFELHDLQLRFYNVLMLNLNPIPCQNIYLYITVILN